MATGPQTPVSSMSSPKGKNRAGSSPQTDIFPTPIQPTKPTPSSPPRRQYAIVRASSTPAELTNVGQPSNASRRTLGDLPSTLQKSWNRQQLSKKRSQYYDSAFAEREPNNSARERVAKDSIVTVEVKVNFLVSPLVTRWGQYANIVVARTTKPAVILDRLFLSALRDIPKTRSLHHGSGPPRYGYAPGGKHGVCLPYHRFRTTIRDCSHEEQTQHSPHTSIHERVFAHLFRQRSHTI